MTVQVRQPKGVPVGGQWATTTRAETMTEFHIHRNGILQGRFGR